MRRHAIVVVVSLAFAALFGLVVKDAMTDPHASAEEEAADTVFVQLRSWQRIDDGEELWASAREAGGLWASFGTIDLRRSDVGSAGRLTLSGAENSLYRSYAIEIAGIGLWIWQRYTDLNSIYVEACALPCERRRTRGPLGWSPLGQTPLTLNDGHSRLGYYRYGNLTLAVPRANPGFQSDRQHLLALRDVLEGGATELDWHVSRATADWEGVTVDGAPPRMVARDLSERGLAGELWGWIGDLSQLRELRLDHNSLRGMIPSKLAWLPQLSTLALAGNDFSGCTPWGLPPTAQHDLESLGMPACPHPKWARHADTPYESGAYVVFELGIETYELLFDVPPGRVVKSYAPSGMLNEYIEITTIFQAVQDGFAIHDAHDEDIWLFISPQYLMYEVMRSHYTGCVYDCLDEQSDSALLE